MLKGRGKNIDLHELTRVVKRCKEELVGYLSEFPLCDRLRLHSPLVHSEQGGGEDGRP